MFNTCEWFDCQCYTMEDAIRIYDCCLGVYLWKQPFHKRAINLISYLRRKKVKDGFFGNTLFQKNDLPRLEWVLSEIENIEDNDDTEAETDKIQSLDTEVVFEILEDIPLHKELWIEIHLIDHRKFSTRLWTGLKYLFGYKCRYGDFDELVITKAAAKKTLKEIDHWMGVSTKVL